MHPGSTALRWILPALSLAILTPACAPGAEGEGYVLLDPAARAAGLQVEIDGEARSSPLPAAVPEGAIVVLVGPDRRDALDLAPGELVHVRGAGARIERGVPSFDRVRIRAAPVAARTFADRLGAPLVAQGHGRFLIVAPDALPLAALVEETQGIEALEPLIPAEEAKKAARDSDDDDDEGEAIPGIVAASAASARSIEELQRLGGQIQKDLSIRIARTGPPVVEVGGGIALDVELVNQGWAKRAIVKPGDGSEVGWREPYVFYTAEREAAPGVWESVPKASYGRCGNYDEDWGKDVVDLQPGASISLSKHWLMPPNLALDLVEPGRVRIKAHYRYGAGSGSGFRYRADVSVPEELRGMPPFEIVSDPVEIRIERPLEAILTLKAPLQVRGGTRLGSLFDLSLVNHSDKAIPLPVGDEETAVSFEFAHGQEDWPAGWWSPKAVRGQTPSLLPGDAVSILGGDELAGERGYRRPDSDGMVRVRASVRVFDWRDARRRDVKSNWVTAPVAWIAR